MGFTKSYEDVKSEPAGGAGDYLRYFKDGDTTFRLLQEPNDWVGYWEHFNPGGFSFPCTQDRKTCPGCTSSNEKMKKAGRKIAIQVLSIVDGTEYVNVYKFPKTLADKLDNRFQRIGTLTDRDYTITKFKSGDKVEYDVEGQEKSPVDVTVYELKDVEAMLQASYDEAWGDGEKAQENRQKAADAEATGNLKSKIQRAAKEEPKPAPAEDKVWTEEELRAMDSGTLLDVIKKELGTEPPASLITPDELVDWLLNQD